MRGARLRVREICGLPTTSFIGRESEVAEVQAALKAHRLVTLTGVGGVGKTRLAMEVAAQLADEFPDGVWVFELAAVADPAAVPDAVAAVLGITQQPGKSVGESVAAALEGRVAAVGVRQLRARRRRAPPIWSKRSSRTSATVKVLATSREGLGVADEQLWLVPSLDVGAGIDSAAVNLFVERAQSVAPRFSMATADEADAVVEICRRLDGIPLAIELAASRMASMTASEVRDRLDDRFRLLVGSRRGLERHQTLRHAVAWSYDLLDDAEKTLLERCSVFAGGFDLQSACAVAGFDDVDDYAVLDLLDALVRKSLLVADRSSGRTRFSMLETIRQFAEEQLVASGEADRGPGRACPLLRWARSRHPGAVGQPPAAGGVRLVHHRAGQLAHRLSVGRRPRRPRRGRPYRHLRGITRRSGRKLRADSLGRRADRACPRRRPSPAGVPVRDGVAVLNDRTDRGGCPLQRRRADRLIAVAATRCRTASRAVLGGCVSR